MRKRFTAYTRNTRRACSTHTHRYWFFTKLFDSNTNFGAACTDTGAGARTQPHSASIHQMEDFKNVLLIVMVTLTRTEPRLHFRWEIFQFSMRWPLPRSHCILAASESLSLATRVCVCATPCPCVLLARFECFRRLVLSYHLSIFRSKMCVKIFSAHFRLLNFRRFLEEHDASVHVLEIRFDLFFAPMVAREGKTSCEAH